MTDQIELTAHIIETAEPPATGQRFIRDTLISGFALRITATGAKAYIIEARVNGRTRRVTLGKHPNLNLRDARKKAKQTLGQFAFGQDVTAVKRAERVKAISLQEVFDAYIKSRDLKPGTVADYRKALRHVFPDWLTKPVVSITRDMVERRHAHFSEERSEARANNAMRVLRALLNYAAGKYEDADGNPIMSDNPVKRLSATKAWNRIERRRTIIKPHQLPAWFAAVQAEAEAHPVTGDYFQLVIMTGLRREEAARLTWANVDFKAKALTVADTKNREPHTLPLSDYLLDLLTARRQADPTGVYVFPGSGKAGYLNTPAKAIERITAQSGIAFCTHDLRRTFVTLAESLDIPAYALKRLLNHRTTSDVTAGYIVIDVERLREPMQRITDYILKAAGVKVTAPIIDLAAKRSG